MSEQIIVKHSGGSYPIHFGGCLTDMSELLGDLADKNNGYDQVALVVNQQVNDLYSDAISGFSKRIYKTFTSQHPPILVADGEKHKTISTVEDISAQLSQLGLSRQSCLIAIGGGVTTDLVGYVAASYMRGIDYIQVPTTLLSQVDASIGGKTAVNLSSGKNLVGAFHQPQAVLVCSGFLEQLPQDELSCGFAEIIKHGLLADSNFFKLLEDSIANTAPAQMQDIIRHACQIKADIVSEDEKERAGGRRALLNLGHTFAHALEAIAQYKSLKHGQAVAIGIVIASRISKQLGDLNDDDCSRIVSLLDKAGLPTTPQEYFPDEATTDKAIDFIMRDKKKHDSRVPLILLKQIGEAYISEPHSQGELKTLLTQALQ